MPIWRTSKRTSNGLVNNGNGAISSGGIAVYVGLTERCQKERERAPSQGEAVWLLSNGRSSFKTSKKIK